MDLSEKIAATAVTRSKCRSSGQARPPAHPRLRGRRHEAADGLVGPGHPKVGGSHHLRELHQVRVLHWRQTVAGAHVRPEGEEGGEEKRSSSADGRRQGRDWFSQERQSGVPARDEWRKKALGILPFLFYFLHQTVQVLHHWGNFLVVTLHLRPQRLSVNAVFLSHPGFLHFPHSHDELTTHLDLKPLVRPQGRH